MALAGIEAAMDVPEPSRIVEVMRAEMEGDPAHWRAYVAPGSRETAMMLYGLSDRVRYYWPRPAIQAALGRLYDNIAASSPEPGIVAQFTGSLVDGTGEPATLARRVIDRMVGDVVRKYRGAAAS